MKNTTTVILALASAATSLASAAAAVAESLGGQPGSVNAPVTTATDEDEAPAAEPKKRGRPAKPAAPAEEEQEEEAPAPKVKGKTLDELKAIIAAAIKAGKGSDVTAIIEKHAGTGKKLKDLAELPDKHKAFEKDIAAISADAEEDY